MLIEFGQGHVEREREWRAAEQSVLGHPDRAERQRGPAWPLPSSWPQADTDSKWRTTGQYWHRAERPTPESENRREKPSLMLLQQTKIVRRVL